VTYSAEFHIKALLSKASQNVLNDFNMVTLLRNADSTPLRYGANIKSTNGMV